MSAPTDGFTSLSTHNSIYFLSTSHYNLERFSPVTYKKYVPCIETLKLGIKADLLLSDIHSQYLGVEDTFLVGCKKLVSWTGNSTNLLVSRFKTSEGSVIDTPFHECSLVGYGKLVISYLKGHGYQINPRSRGDMVMPKYESYDAHLKALKRFTRGQSINDDLYVYREMYMPKDSGNSLYILKSHFIHFWHKDHPNSTIYPHNHNDYFNAQLNYLNGCIEDLDAFRLYAIRNKNSTELLGYICIHELDTEVYWVNNFLLRNNETKARRLGNFSILWCLKYAYEKGKRLNLGLNIHPYKQLWGAQNEWQEGL